MSVPRGVSKANEDLWSKFIRLDSKHGAYYQVQCKACAEYAHIHGADAAVLQGRIERMKTHLTKCPHGDPLRAINGDDESRMKRAFRHTGNEGFDGRRDFDEKRFKLTSGDGEYRSMIGTKHVESERLRKLEENREQLEQQLLLEKIKREKINAMKEDQQCKVELLLSRQTLREKGVPQDEIDLLLPLTQPQATASSTFV
ncbi:hypothetical protein H257_01594 [Aphanomyces astaci]|uniref:BED-type domain-containing protein n=1 Tax=Aphanomyces astaci TaxID=112090 RepID=W4H8F2_APHAT|nr:hypothetical protein H257_01594 [Aphanomyces astaci]ETV88320.1 hypothetical protein H257_01594 [Aphanomyces astaci]KAF0750455.1 hypothetical protein AaE_006703 [Aphanomyces astaci]RHY13077.1 hypothetical protein DYB36_007675 [Aphanomyces astaci]RHY22345.1 hypothetical protein DYB25_000367 [Aphanomyces astaci]RHY42286.1 hypothetical protein DYB38_000125 [Aphanomyces astaci]|eukprot:XP_009823183.1 hypothetical protein H257_01594 [Aphanomyces astaci]